MITTADPKLSGSAAMAGNLEKTTGLAAIILWNSGHFDTLEIAELLNVKEDAVYRVLHAARHVAKGGR